MKPETKYCTYIDVLGYKNIVESEILDLEAKIRILNSIYKNLFSSISFQLKLIRSNQPENKKLFIKSFSDNVYLEDNDPAVILFALHNIYCVTFGYNSNFSQKEEYTPLLRSGTVKDWSLRFMDIGSLARQSMDNIYKNDEFNNPVGLAVARAYLTSEESNLSGMRIIINAKVVEDLLLTKVDNLPFACYYFECPNYLKQDDLPKTHRPIKLFLLPVKTADNSNNREELFELCWPVFSYTWSNNNSDIHTFINEFFKMKVNFSENSMRHYKSTGELLLKGLILTCKLFEAQYDQTEVKKVVRELQIISGTSFDL